MIMIGVCCFHDCLNVSFESVYAEQALFYRLAGADVLADRTWILRVQRDCELFGIENAELCLRSWMRNRPSHSDNHQSPYLGSFLLGQHVPTPSSHGGRE